MVLIVEDGTGLENAESYASVSYCDSYHSAMENTTWTGTDSAKESALRKATQYLESNYTWKGELYSFSQALSFPMVDIEDNYGRDLSMTIPVQLMNATAELALIALYGDLNPNIDNNNYVKKEKVGNLEVEYRDNAPTKKIYSLVNSLLNGLFNSKSGSISVSLGRA